MPRNPAAKQAVKNGRRAKRKGRRPAWMNNQPVMKRGAGGTDKSPTRNNGRPPWFSNDPADR